MPIFSKENKKALFIHVPKSAGSSIERIADDLGWEESFSIRGKPLKDLEHWKSTLQHLHAEPLEMLFNLDEFDLIFMVVRNPFSRFKSEYYWQRSQKVTNLCVEDWIDDTFSRYSCDAYVFDNHIRPQVEFIVPREKLKVFKLEEGGVAQAKEALLSLSGLVKPKKTWSKSLLGRFTRERQEKRSSKDSDIEDRFAKQYDRIVEFYKTDYEAFFYDR